MFVSKINRSLIRFCWWHDEERPWVILLQEYRSRSCVLGREVTVYTGQEEYTARAVEIDDAGALVVETALGRRKINAGEVSLRMGERK